MAAPAPGSDYGASRAVAIFGYVYTPDHVPIVGINVTWNCISHPTWQTIGTYQTDDYGKYEVPEGDIEPDHNYHDLRGEVYHEVYGWSYAFIPHYNPGLKPYSRDFVKWEE